MKKLFVVLLALTVFGIFAFADDAAAPALVLSGYLNTGFIYSQGGGVANSIKLNADDAGKQSRFNVAGKYDAGDYGVYFRYREQNTLSNATPAVFVNRAYGWFNVLNGMVKLQAGKLATGTYATGQDEDFGDWDTTAGFEVAVMPTEGLTLGGMLPVTLAGDSASRTMKGMWAGAKYSAKGLADVSFGYHSNPEPKLAEMFAYLGVTAVENLTAYLEFDMANIGAKLADGFFDTATPPEPIIGTTTAYVHGDYTMDVINVGANVEYVMSAESDLGTKMKIDPFASYTMGNTKVGGDFMYYSANKADTKSYMEIKPYVKFTLGKGSLKAAVDYVSGAYDLLANGDKTPATTKVFVDYVFNF